MKTTILNLLAALFFATAFQIHAQGFVYDQQSATGPISYHTVDFFNIQEDSPLTQSFIPTLQAIGFIQFEFIDPANNGNNGATVYVNLWTGSPNTNSATFLGSTIPVYMPNGFGYGVVGSDVTNFYFSTPIAVTSGQTYYLQPVVLSGDDPWEIAVLTNTYPNGALYASGFILQPGSDFWFREGVLAVPEPSTFALIGLGSFLIVSFKRRFKIFVLLLFSISAFQIYAQSDSVVQATAENAGLTSPTALPRIGTYWIISVNFDGTLTKMPYPMLPPEMAGLPIYYVTNGIYIVDDTGGHISNARMSRAQSAAIAQRQANDVGDLVTHIQTVDDESFQPDDFSPMFIDTNGLWLEALNQGSNNVLLRLHNTIVNDNYQLLSTSNLLNTNWNFGQIANASDIEIDYSLIAMTNAMTFYRAHHANPIMEIYNSQNSEELCPTNVSNTGYSGVLYVENEWYAATNDISVYYSIGGTAVNGIDYSNLTGEVIMTAGSYYTEIDINPTDDGLKPDQNIILTLLQNTNYLVDPNNYSATNILLSNPDVYPTALGDAQYPYPNMTNTIQLNYYDPRSLPVTYTITSFPIHGTLDTNDISSGEVYYTPTNCYEGPDSLTFYVNDGQYNSAPHTIPLTISDSVYVNSINQLSGNGIPINITLNGYAYSGAAISYDVSNPAHGTLNGTAPNLTYTANTNFTGVDTFNYIAYTDCGDSATNTVSILDVPEPTLFTECDPFGPAVKLNWSLDSDVTLGEEQYGLNILGYVIYRSSVPGGPYTAIYTNDPNQINPLNYTDTNSVVGQTNYYVVSFQFWDSSETFYESPFSNEIAASGRNPLNLISANAYWNVTDITYSNSPVPLGIRQAPFSNLYPTQYPNLYPLPNTNWPTLTTWSNHISFYVPTNTDLSQVQYSIAIDNDYKLYLNNSANYIDMLDHQNDATWGPFQSFTNVAPGLLHYGTNDIGVVIQDTEDAEGTDIDYFSMVVTTNTCGF